MNQCAPIKGTSRDKAIVDATMDLEGDVAALQSMASILADLLDNGLNDIRDGVRQDGDNWSIVLTSEQMNNLCFAWNDVLHRATMLQERYLAAVSAN